MRLNLMLSEFGMTSTIVLSATALAAALALISLGGGLYEFSVVDPA